MRADRLLALLLLLQSRGRLTAAELATRLEVSVRTIYRDIEALGAAGVPVYTEAGTGGGCQLLEGYRSPLRGLTVEEAHALLALGVPDALRDVGLGGALQGAQQHVRSAAGLPPTAPGTRIHLDLPRWFQSREDVPHLPTLAEAVDRTTRVRITRRRAGADHRRTVDPLGLVNKAGVWYVVARPSPDRTTVYRVGRITAAVALDETFARPDGFDLVAYWEAWSADFEASRPRLEVTVHASPAALAALPEIFGDNAHAVVAAAGEPDADGWRTITLTFDHEGAAAYRLAGFGDLVTVLAPARVRDLLVEVAQGTLRRHAGDRA